MIELTHHGKMVDPHFTIENERFVCDSICQNLMEYEHRLKLDVQKNGGALEATSITGSVSYCTSL